jgi:hypothetical protein
LDRDQGTTESGSEKVTVALEYTFDWPNPATEVVDAGLGISPTDNQTGSQVTVDQSMGEVSQSSITYGTGANISADGIAQIDASLKVTNGIEVSQEIKVTQGPLSMAAGTWWCYGPLFQAFVGTVTYYTPSEAQGPWTAYKLVPYSGATLVENNTSAFSAFAGGAIPGVYLDQMGN